MAKRVKWEEADRTFVKQNADKLTDQQLTDRLSEAKGRSISVQTVRKLRQSLGIVKARGRGACKVLNPDATKV